MRTIKDIAELTKEDLLSEELVQEAFTIDDDIKREVLLSKLTVRATELKCARGFGKIVRSFQTTLDNAKKAQKIELVQATIDGITNFSGIETQLRCGQWIATDNGISMKNLNPYFPDRLACYHPIYPVERMKNLQTGEEQVKLRYKRPSEEHWSEITVAKNVIASHQRIIDLSSYGIAVTSENSKWLVLYLSDIENLNEASIKLKYSTSKLGWIHHKDKDFFLPYVDGDIEFDGGTRFAQVFNSIHSSGDYQVWLNHIKSLRASGRLEIRLMMAASLASVLVKPCGTLPFIVDLWGDTEGGKTVTLMVAASIWADPGNNAYIGDFKATDTALEAKADMLNSLPLILDDTSKVSRKLKDQLEGLIYDLCSGKGKSRSNKALGINRENTWNCVTLSCGEKPLQDYAEQGGAINRILEIQCGENLYADPHETAELVKTHYGFFGQDFIRIISLIGPEKLEERRRELYDQISRDDKMQKQAYAMSVILLADRIAADMLKDGITISPEEAISVMTDRQAVSDNQRAYEYLMDKVSMNPTRFDMVTDKSVEQWGAMSESYVYFYASALDMLLKEENFGLRPFVAWANKQGLLMTDSDGVHMAKKVKLNGKSYRMYAIRLPDADQQAPEPEKQLDLTQAELDMNGEGLYLP